MIGIGRARRKLIDQLAVRTLPLNQASQRENLPEIIFSEYSTVISSFSRLLFSTSIRRTCIKMLFWLHQVVSYRREARGGGGSWERNCFVEHRKKIFGSLGQHCLLIAAWRSARMDFVASWSLCSRGVNKKRLERVSAGFVGVADSEKLGKQKHFRKAKETADVSSSQTVLALRMNKQHFNFFPFVRFSSLFLHTQTFKRR